MAQDFGFELQREENIGEINALARVYRHRKTGARLLSMISEDENKSFGITFRTPPPDSTGVAHILEHSVLCGSRKYPVKEPFVELMKSSLNTFLNALTYPDKTVYPVASTNLKDFYNLVDVYLDAVFFPRITPEIFQQEGWHYELEKPEDPLIYKGVVYNEMKGAYSTPRRLISQYSRQSLFPNHVYGRDSGGNPREIPRLTYEQFRRFHQTYYHPSNAYIFFYGDDDPEKRLEILDAYLREFDPIEVPSEIPPQPRLAEHRRIRKPYYPGSAPEAAHKGMATVNWLLGEYPREKDQLLIELLDQVLVGTPAAPLWKALIDSGLGEDLCAFGLGGDLRQMIFSVGLLGVAVENLEKVEPLVFETLERLSKEGISRNTVEAALNTIEFHLRENNTGSFPRGLAYMLRALSNWIYGRDPLAPLAFEKPLEALKQELKQNPRVLEDLIRELFLENLHRTTVILEPDEHLGEAEERAEQERLARIKASLKADELQKIIENTRRLREFQNQPDPPEALATLPRLHREDLERMHKPLPIEVLPAREGEILYHDLFTNGILYLEVGFNLRRVPQRLLPYIRLFGRALLEMGTEKEDFVSLTERIGRETGGISPSTFISTKANGKDAATWFFLNGKAMVGQTEKLLNILEEVLLSPRLEDQERFRQIVLDAKAGKEQSLAAHGTGYVQNRLSACFTEAGWLNELLGGVSSLFFVRELLQRIEQDWEGVLADLRELHHRLINRRGMIVNVTVDGPNWQRIRPQVEQFLGALPAAEASPQEWHPELFSGSEGLAIPAQVNFVGKAANLYDLGYRFHGSALVIQNFLKTAYLWNRVRVQGGAYGAYCSFNHRSGIFGFLSYRDPNILPTLAAYDQAGEFLRQAELDEDELTRNIIGVIGDLDAYKLPDAKGYTAMARYLLGESDESLQQLRDEVFATTPRHFQDFAAALEALRQHGRVVIAGPEENLQRANQELPQKVKITPVL